MKAMPSALLLDDDPNVLNVMSLRLSQRFPGLRLECRHTPNPSGDYDVFLLDNDFYGDRLAADLAEEIRRRCPHSLIIAFSSVLDTDALKRLINCGCSGAFDKGKPADIERMLALIESHLAAENRKNMTDDRDGRRSAGTVRAISELIREWNSRLAAQESPDPSLPVDSSRSH